MEGAEKNRGNDNVSWRMNGVVSGDLVHQFVNQSHFPNQMGKIKTEEDEEIELSLGLSMNGRFGVDPARKKLRRTSSVSNWPYPVGSVENGCTEAAGGSYAPLVRTCSLPTDTEEWRRQESQSSVRCMEARKKRMEKLKNVRVVRSDKENSSEDGNGLHDDVNGTVSVQRLDSGIVRGIEKWNLTPSSQGSVGLRRMGSSGASDLHNQGARENPATERPNVKAAESDARDEDNLLKNPLLDMPYVSTRGCGPNHSKIEGFLYRYKKGEEVKIVCVCHGLFLTPAEFVKHGGGGEVSQPLKHIVVNPFPLF